MQFTQEDHKIWETLFARQIPNVTQHACRAYLRGLRMLRLSALSIPSLRELNAVVQPRTLWRVFRTPVRYLSDIQWAKHIGEKQFPVTSYIRRWNDLDFTPEPDVFHDTLGHLPHLLSSEMRRLIMLFSRAYLNAPNRRVLDQIAQLWWNTIEFTVIPEEGRIKLFGAGLMTSFSECNFVLQGKAVLCPWSIEKAIEKPRAVYNFHKELLVIPSVDDVIDELRKFVDNFSSAT